MITLTPGRIVAILTPLVFAPAAGALAAYVAEHFPGLSIGRDQIQQIFIAGALTALAPALHWLHGWQQYETRQELAIADAASDVAVGDAELDPADADLDAIDDDGLDDLGPAFDPDDLDDLDALDAELARG